MSEQNVSDLDATLSLLSNELNQLAFNQRQMFQSPTRDEAGDELVQLRLENVHLRKRVSDLQSRLHASSNAEEKWAEHQSRYERLFDENSETIRILNMRLQELRNNSAPPPSETLSEEDARDYVNMQREMEDLREQIQEDEESLLAQMREMEMTLSRERADLGRQRQELQRHQEQLNRRLDQGNRNADLNEQLKNVRRTSETMAKPATLTPPDGTNTNRRNTIIRRIFG